MFATKHLDCSRRPLSNRTQPAPCHYQSEYLNRARSESDADVRERFVVIAQHYCTLAKAEERSAEQTTTRRVSPDLVH